MGEMNKKNEAMKKKMEGCKDTTDEEMKKKCAMMQMKMDCMDEEKMMKMNEEMKRKCMMMKKEYNEQEAEKSKLDYYVAKCKKGEDEDAKMCEMAEFKMKCMDEEVMEKMPKEMQMKCKRMMEESKMQKDEELMKKCMMMKKKMKPKKKKKKKKKKK